MTRRLTAPDFSVEPREIVSLGVVVAQDHVVAVDDLLDLGEGDPVSLGAEGHESLQDGIELVSVQHILGVPPEIGAAPLWNGIRGFVGLCGSRVI